MSNEEKVTGVRVVDEVRYFNMRKCYEFMGMSPQGWRNLRDSLIKQKELAVHVFKGDPKSVYVKEDDLKDLKTPHVITSLEELRQWEESGANSTSEDEPSE